MTIQEIYDLLKIHFNDDIKEITDISNGDSFITVNPANIFDILQFCRDYETLDFDYLTLISGMDSGENLGVVYHLYSMKFKHSIVIKAFVPKESPNIQSVVYLWRAADWHEREAFDLIGVVFDGHPNLIRILCPYDWEGHPLRKDYVTPQEYHGMKVPY